MVLSNKKLKQKLRAQLAESLAKSESQVNEPNLKESQTHHSFKSLLSSANPKPKLSKREKRRDKIPSLLETLHLQNGAEEKESEQGNGQLTNNNKRKRIEVKDVDVDKEENDLSEKKSSKKKKKKKKNNKNKKMLKKEEGESVQKANAGSEEIVVAEPTLTLTHTRCSNEDASNSTKVYVGGIPYYSTVDDIRSYFEGCGSITEIDCLKFPETGKFNGIAMISFRTEAAAKRALALDGSDMGGLSLKVQPYKATRDKKVSDFAPAMLDGYNRIYIGNLSWDMTEDELKKFFSDCRISSIRLGKDKETGEFRGFAHVDFANSLSLTMALKLDQKPLFGRPVRIRCAIPPKSSNPSSNSEPTVGKNEGTVDSAPINDDVARKAKRQTCYVCGEKGHLSSSCPNKKASDDVAFDKSYSFSSMGPTDKEEIDNVDEGKLKRRTCYDCGEKGHISSLCPNKKASDDAFDKAYEEEVDNAGECKLKRRTCYECGEKGHLSSSCPKKQAADVANMALKASVLSTGNDGVDNNMMSSVSCDQFKRRTCYECGERGHLSSACLKKQAVDVGMWGKKAEKCEEVKSRVDVGKEGGDNVVSSVSDGKLRRRTCYECGERGHLSSLCPKKQTADMVSSSKEAYGMEVEKAEELKATVAVGGNNVVSCVSGGKLRRRSCYECGEKGHLSSLCLNKKDADLANIGSA